MVGNAYPGSPPDIPPDNVRPTEVQALFHAIGSLATCQTQVIELAGDSGMGKTRLLGALAQEASGVAVACWGAATRLHGAVSDRCFGPSSADGEREA